ncbi:MAG: hypothetical protein V3575_00135 [Candidatus Absconditabacteria bacterium]
MVFKGQINLDLGDAQDSTENESKDTNETKKISDLESSEIDKSKELDKNLPDEAKIEDSTPEEPTKEVEAVVEEVSPNSDFAISSASDSKVAKSEPVKPNEFTLGIQEDDDEQPEPINIDLLPKFKIGESEAKPQKEEKQEPPKNDFSMNLGGTNSTLMGNKSDKGPAIDAANLLPDDLEDDVKVVKKEKVKKEVVQPDVITNIAEGIKVNEDIEIEELNKLINSNMLGKQKRKKTLMYAGLVLLSFTVLGGLGFLIFQNKETILNNLAADILPQQVKPVVTEKIVTQIVDKDEYDVNNYTGDVAIVNREVFKSLQVEDFYKVYKTDFLFIDQANISEKDKKNVLTKLNLLVYAYNKGEIDYPLFRIKYNNLISNMLRMERINEIKINSPQGNTVIIPTEE